jgi:hypothetical protein
MVLSACEFNSLSLQAQVSVKPSTSVLSIHSGLLSSIQSVSLMRTLLGAASQLLLLLLLLLLLTQIV